MKPTWQTDDGRIQLYCGDCLKILPEIGKVDAVITDPPYGLNYEYNSYQDTPENLDKLIVSFIPLSQKKSVRVIILSGITPMFKYPTPDWTIAVTWDTTGSYGFFGYTQWMPILIYGKDIKGIGKVNGMLKSDLIKITGGSGVGFMREKIENDHPCSKPVNIMKLIVRRLTNESDTILDPFMGSGTTGIACIRTGRKFIGIEISPEYFEIAKKRIQNELKQLRFPI